MVMFVLIGAEHGFEELVALNNAVAVRVAHLHLYAVPAVKMTDLICTWVWQKP